MAAERVTAAERAGLDLAELARRVRELAYLRGLDGPDRPIPPGGEGAHLAPGQRAAVLALAELAEGLAAELWEGEEPPRGPAGTVGELRRVLVGLPDAAPLEDPQGGALHAAAEAGAEGWALVIFTEAGDRWRVR